ncbi:hypothetical protein [Corynebacterium provencense]|uniref:hypothetical protein n=1 Tax=Corynebacterium provencense TaxID=1737425 RepID=UPI00082F6D73|nr:hypothetical protein [Corynebacterium provencense]
MDTKKWFAETSHRRITDDVIAELLNVTRKTANKRVNDGLSMDDLVTISRGLDINPVQALVELGHLEYDEVEQFLDSDGQLVATATPGQLSLELARQLNPATFAPELDMLAERRAKKSHDRVPPRPDGEDNGLPLGSVAYSGEDEDARKDQEERDFD